MYKLEYRSSHEPQIISGCDCLYHRYNTVYICGCGKLVSHSQGNWDEHRLHPNGINIPSEYFYHDDNATTLYHRLQGWGLIPYFDNGFQNVSDAMSEMQEKKGLMICKTNSKS